MFDWIIITDKDDSFPDEGVDVLVSDGVNYDVAYYIRSGSYKWVKVDLIRDDIDDFKSFEIIKWCYIK